MPSRPRKKKARTVDGRTMAGIASLLVLCLALVILRSLDIQKEIPSYLTGNSLFTINAALFASTIDIVAALVLGVVAAMFIVWFFDIDFKFVAEDSKLAKITASFAGPGAFALVLIAATYWILKESRQNTEEVMPKLAISSLFSHSATTARDAQTALVNQGKLEAKIQIQQELLQLALGSGTAKLRLDMDFFCRWWDGEAEKFVGRRVDNVVLTNERAPEVKSPSAMIVAKDEDYVIYVKGEGGKEKRVADISFKVNDQNGNPVIVVGVTKGFQEICSTTPPPENVPETAESPEPPPEPLQ